VVLTLELLAVMVVRAVTALVAALEVALAVVRVRAETPDGTK
jgi:hypothetical protein